jgi:hypothetical protein
MSSVISKTHIGLIGEWGRARAGTNDEQGGKNGWKGVEVHDKGLLQGETEGEEKRNLR